MNVKEIYFSGRLIKLRIGSLVRFWKGPWLNNTPLMQSFPLLYDICQVPDITFKQCVADGFDLPFRRRFYQDLTDQWSHIINRAKEIPLCVSDDSVVWNLTASTNFTTKSV